MKDIHQILNEGVSGISIQARISKAMESSVEKAIKKAKADAEKWFKGKEMRAEGRVGKVVSVDVFFKTEGDKIVVEKILLSFGYGSDVWFSSAKQAEFV